MKNVYYVWPILNKFERTRQFFLILSSSTKFHENSFSRSQVFICVQTWQWPKLFQQASAHRNHSWIPRMICKPTASISPHAFRPHCLWYRHHVRHLLNYNDLSQNDSSHFSQKNEIRKNMIAADTRRRACSSWKQGREVFFGEHPVLSAISSVSLPF
jgi:hypothetical protein